MTKWQDLLILPKWCPLAKSGLEISPQEEGNYRISEDAFVSLSKFNFKENSSDGAPFITAILWAPTEGVLKRVWDMEIEKDEGTPSIKPPHELLPDGAHTYGRIVTTLQSKQIQYLETASYRIASDGKFVAKQIMSHPYTYYFRNPANDDDEVPIAIQFSLIGK